jgi:hypothetical protein
MHRTPLQIKAKEKIKMRIAIIGWGSLIWDPRDLPREGTWQDDGPELKIEFKRISKDARLTLVIDSAAESLVKTKYVLSPRTCLDDAAEDLRSREGTSRKRIGWVNVTDNTTSGDQYGDQIDVHSIITCWCKKKRFDGAVWTALRPNFEKELEKPSTINEALCYLGKLPKNVRAEALRYIENAPDCVQTPFRKAVMKKFIEKGLVDHTH